MQTLFPTHPRPCWLPVRSTGRRRNKHDCVRKRWARCSDLPEMKCRNLHPRWRSLQQQILTARCWCVVTFSSSALPAAASGLPCSLVPLPAASSGRPRTLRHPAGAQTRWQVNAWEPEDFLLGLIIGSTTEPKVLCLETGRQKWTTFPQ